MAAEPEPEGVHLPISWAALEDMSVTAANAFLLQVAGDAAGRPVEMVLSVGFLAPPPVGGTAAEQVAQLQELGAAQVKPVVRLTFTRERAEELRSVLDVVLRAWDEARQA
jgi:hypothetical protein